MQDALWVLSNALTVAGTTRSKAAYDTLTQLAGKAYRLGAEVAGLLADEAVARGELPTPLQLRPLQRSGDSASYDGWRTRHAAHVRQPCKVHGMAEVQRAHAHIY